MPPENLRNAPPPREQSKCPWGRDCPWDWPREISFRQRFRWAMQAMQYAITGVHPREPVVLRAAITQRELAQLKLSEMPEKAQELHNTIEYYEAELQAFKASVRGRHA